MYWFYKTINESIYNELNLEIITLSCIPIKTSWTSAGKLTTIEKQDNETKDEHREELLLKPKPWCLHEA